MGTETVHGFGPVLALDFEIEEAVLVRHVRALGGAGLNVETGCDGHRMVSGGF